MPLETTTVWSFPQRGDWSAHRGDYRGNWPPQVPRNLMLRYTREGDRVLDPMCGSGTTLIEAHLLKRRAVGVDANPHAVALARHRLDEAGGGDSQTELYVGDARSLSAIDDASIQLVALHPPYGDIIRYAPDIPSDLSALRGEDFLDAMARVARETHRVLSPGGHVGLLIGDIRRGGRYQLLSYETLQAFLSARFDLMDDVIKVQWNCAATSGWAARRPSFHLIAHEHLFVLRKQ